MTPVPFCRRQIQKMSESEAQLALKKLPETQQIGYLSESSDVAGETVHEVMTVPIFSTETGDVISALVVGFKPFELTGKGTGTGMKSGIWVNGRLHLPIRWRNCVGCDGELAAPACYSCSAVSSPATFSQPGWRCRLRS